MYTSLIAKENDQFSRKIRRIRSVQKPNLPLATNISYYTIWCVVSLGVLTSTQGSWIYKKIITDQSNSKNQLAYFRTTSFAQRYQEKNCCLYNRKLMRQVMWYNSKRSGPIELRIEMQNYFGMRRTGRMLYAKNYNTIWSMCGKFCVGFQMIQRWLIVVGAEINCQTFIKSAPTSKINIMFPIVVENNLQSLPICGQKGGKRSCLITAWQGPTKALPCGFFIALRESLRNLYRISWIVGLSMN